MNCDKKTTRMKVEFIVPLLEAKANNEITALCRHAFPNVVIGDDYVRSVRKAWRDSGKANAEIVLEKLKGSHHGSKQHEPDLFQSIPSDKSPDKLTEHEIACLKQLVLLMDLIKDTK